MIELAKREIELICLAALDIATGNHLLRRRTTEEMSMLKEVCEVLAEIDDGHEDKLTERQQAIYEEYRLCTDYDYAKSKGKA